MKKSKNIFFELIIIFSSVLIFRSLWTLMDKIELLNNSYIHLILLIIGVALFVWAIDKFTNQK